MREELRLGRHRRARGRRPHDVDLSVCATGLVRRPRPRRGSRLVAARGLEQLRPARVDVRSRGGLQIEREIGRTRYALLLAHQPFGVGLDRDRAAGRKRCWNLERDRQKNLAVVAVVGERRDVDARRRGPFDVAGLEAGRQRPLDRRRQSGVAGVAPVRVPLAIHFQAQSQRQRLAGDDCSALGDELGLDVVGLYGRRAHGEGARRQNQRTNQTQ